MKKSIIKKIFIRLSKILGYEIIDQNEFYSPTLEKNLNQDLSTINQKSIVLPLGEVSISRKVNSILIILRTNTKIDIWDQNKKRIFEKPKVEYTLKSINSAEDIVINLDTSKILLTSVPSISNIISFFCRPAFAAGLSI